MPGHCTLIKDLKEDVSRYLGSSADAALDGPGNSSPHTPKFVSEQQQMSRGALGSIDLGSSDCRTMTCMSNFNSLKHLRMELHVCRDLTWARDLLMVSHTPAP